MVVALRALLCARRPKAPVLSKWTKLCPAVDWYLPWIACGGGAIAAQLFRLAFSKIQRKDRNEGDETILDSVSFWKQLERSRVRRILEGAEDRQNNWSLLLLALVIEPVRLITYYFLRYARESALHSTSTFPCLIDLASPEFSVVWHAMQSLSSLLDGSSPRLILAWRFVGATSLQELGASELHGNVASLGLEVD